MHVPAPVVPARRAAGGGLTNEERSQKIAELERERRILELEKEIDKLKSES